MGVLEQRGCSSDGVECSSSSRVSPPIQCDSNSSINKTESNPATISTLCEDNNCIQGPSVNKNTGNISSTSSKSSYNTSSSPNSSSSSPNSSNRIPNSSSSNTPISSSNTPISSSNTPISSSNTPTSSSNTPTSSSSSPSRSSYRASSSRLSSSNRPGSHTEFYSSSTSKHNDDTSATRTIVRRRKGSRRNSCSHDDCLSISKKSYTGHEAFPLPGACWATNNNVSTQLLLTLPSASPKRSSGQSNTSSRDNSSSPSASTRQNNSKSTNTNVSKHSSSMQDNSSSRVYSRNQNINSNQASITSKDSSTIQTNSSCRDNDSGHDSHSIHDTSGSIFLNIIYPCLQSTTSSSTNFKESIKTDWINSKDSCSSSRSSTITSSSPTSRASISSREGVSRSIDEHQLRERDDACAVNGAATPRRPPGAPHRPKSERQEQNTTAGTPAKRIFSQNKNSLFAKSFALEGLTTSALAGVMGARAAVVAAAAEKNSKHVSEAQDKKGGGEGNEEDQGKKHGGVAALKKHFDVEAGNIAGGEHDCKKLDCQETGRVVKESKHHQEILDVVSCESSCSMTLGTCSIDCCCSRTDTGKEQQQQQQPHDNTGAKTKTADIHEGRAPKAGAGTYRQRVSCTYSLRNSIRRRPAIAATISFSSKEEDKEDGALKGQRLATAVAESVASIPLTRATAARGDSGRAASHGAGATATTAATAEGKRQSGAMRRRRSSSNRTACWDSNNSRNTYCKSSRTSSSLTDACSNSNYNSRKLPSDSTSSEGNRRRNTRRRSKGSRPNHNSNLYNEDKGTRRVNPRRACRTGDPVPCGLEWTRRLVAAAKEKAAALSWSAQDSPSLRQLLKIRREPKESVGLGLYLEEPLQTCCCSIWRRLQQQQEYSTTSQQQRSPRAADRTTAAADMGSAALGGRSSAVAGAGGDTAAASGEERPAVAAGGEGGRSAAAARRGSAAAAEERERSAAAGRGNSAAPAAREGSVAVAGEYSATAARASFPTAVAVADLTRVAAGGALDGTGCGAAATGEAAERHIKQAAGDSRTEFCTGGYVMGGNVGKVRQQENSNKGSNCSSNNCSRTTCSSNNCREDSRRNSTSSSIRSSHGWEIINAVGKTTAALKEDCGWTQTKDNGNMLLNVSPAVKLVFSPTSSDTVTTASGGHTTPLSIKAGAAAAVGRGRGEESATAKESVKKERSLGRNTCSIRETDGGSREDRNWNVADGAEQISNKSNTHSCSSSNSSNPSSPNSNKGSNCPVASDSSTIGSACSMAGSGRSAVNSSSGVIGSTSSTGACSSYRTVGSVYSNVGGDFSTVNGGLSTVGSSTRNNKWAAKTAGNGLNSRYSSSARECGCSQETGGFRVLCFRGDVVLSPHNDRSTSPLMSTEEKQLIYDPEQNPEIPFSFQLQAHRYLLGDEEEEVKAIYANHYCARHCSAFFDINHTGTPCIVTRPGAEIEAGPFGVFYGWNKSSSFPCAKEGCGHICKPRCGACFSIEMQWRKCWRMHRRYAVREEVSATTVSNKLGTKREGVGKDEKVKTAAVGEEDVDDPLLHTGRREGTLGVVEKQQGLYWEEKQHLVPSLCFSEEEEQEGGKEKDQDEGAGILFEDEDEEKERVEGREKRRGGSNEKKTRRARGIGATGATDEEKKRQDEKQETEGVTRRSGNTEQETREKNKQQYIQVRTQQHPQMVKTQQQQQQEQQLRLPHRVEQPQSQSTDDGSSGGKDVKMSCCASDNVESSGPALGRRSEVKTQHALLPAHATEMKNAREQFATGAQRRQESLKAAAGEGVFATVVVTKPEEKAIAAEKEGVYLWGCAKKEKHSPSEKGASSSSYEVQSVQSSRGSLAAVATPIASAEAKTTCEEDKEAWGEKVYAGSCGCLNRLISSKSRNCCCGEDVHTTPRRKWCECTQEEFFQFKCKKSNSCRAHTKSGSRSAVAMEMRLDQTAAAATASNDAGANYCSPGTLYRRASTMTWDEEQEVGEEEETQEVNHSDIPLEKQLLLHVTSLAGGSSIRVPITKNCNLKRGEVLSGDKTVEASTWRTGALMSADEVPAAAIATASAAKAAAAAAGEARRTAVAAEREATGESAGEARRDAKNAAERQEETEKSTLDNSGRDDEIVCEEGRTQRGQHRKKDASCGLGKEDATLNSFKQQLRREQGEKNSSNSSSNSAIDTLAAWEPRTAVCRGRRRAGDDVVAAVCAAVAVLRAAVAAEAEMAKYLDKEEETFSEKEVLTKKIEAEKEEENSAVSKNARDVSLARDILPSMQDLEKHHHMSRKRPRSGFLSEEAKDQREDEKTSTITPRTGEKQEGTEKSVQLHVLELCPRKTAASCPSAEISYCATSEKAALKQVSRKTRCWNEGRSEQHIALPVEVAEVLSSTEAVTEEEKGPLMCSTSRRCCAVSPWWPLQDQSPLTQQTKKQQQEEEAEKFCSAVPAALGELNTSCSVHAQQEAGISPTDVIPQRSKKCRCSMPAPICERRREGDLALIQAASLLDADPACCAAFAALAAVVPLASPVYLRPLPPLLPRSVTPAEKPCSSSSCTQWLKSKLPGCCCGCYDREQNNSDWRSCCDRCNRNCCTGQGTGRVCSTPCLTTSVSSVSSIASIMGNVAKLVHKPSSIQQSIQEVTEPPMKDRRQISTVTLLVDAATRLLLSLSAAATADRGNDSNNSKEVPLPR